MTSKTTVFNNLLNINLKNRKSRFKVKYSVINNKSKVELIKMNKLNVLNFKKTQNDLSIDLKFFENRFVFKNFNKWS